MELENNLVLASVGCGFILGICSMCLNFIIKSRCKKISVCGCLIERDVIDSNNLSRNVINIPNNLAN